MSAENEKAPAWLGYAAVVVLFGGALVCIWFGIF